MNKVINFLLNRNVILIFALLLGLTTGTYAHYLKDYTLYFLMVVMIFSTTGINLTYFQPLKQTIKPTLQGILLSYVIFGSLIIFLAWLFAPNDEIFYGFVIIAATPPGVAILPFTYVLKGNVKYSITALLGTFIASIFITPFIIYVFTDNQDVSSWDIILFTLKLIIVPIFLSRLLLFKKIEGVVMKIRGKVVDFGLALVMYVAIGVNQHVFYSNFSSLFIIIGILFFMIFVLGFIYEKYLRSKKEPIDAMISKLLFLTIKSSGFAIVTALTFYNETVAIPASVISIFILLYFIYLSFKTKSER